MIKINEIFYSIQGEGSFVGAACIFIRFSGCNLKCKWCDTWHQNFEAMSIEQIVAACKLFPCKRIVITGGEPCHQMIMLEKLVRRLKDEDYFVMIESNGTFYMSEFLLSLLDHIVISPKGKTQQCHCDDLKIIEDNQSVEQIKEVAKHFSYKQLYIQPMSHLQQSIQRSVDLVKKEPKWKLSIQIHKVLNIK